MQILSSQNLSQFQYYEATWTIATISQTGYLSMEG